MSGPEMLLQAALKAFVPKETAANISAAIEGMLKDGSLDGIATLVSDVAEIKRSQARIEFGLGRIFAGLSLEQQIHSRGKSDSVPGSPGNGTLYAMASECGPFAVAGPGECSDAGGEPDRICSGDAGTIAGFGSEAAE